MYRLIENYLYRLGLKQKLMLFVILVVIFLILQSAYILKTDYDILNQYREDNQSYSKISELKKTVAENNNYLNDYFNESLLKTTNHFNDSTLEILSGFNRTGYEIFNIIEILDNSSKSLEEHLLIQAIRNSCDIYRIEANATIREHNNNVTTNQDKVNKMYLYIDTYIDQLLEQSSYTREKSYEQLFVDWNRSKNLTVLIIIIIIVGIILMGSFFSEYITNNIKQIIMMQTKIATGDFKNKAHPNQMKDEMGELNRSLNHMQQSIKERMDQLNEKALMERRLYQEELLNLEMQKSLDEAKYAMLQSQINPHFLFNTLNIISRKAMFKDSDEAVRLIKALSELFRHSLVDVSEKTSLSKELDVMEEYLYIQKTRFRNRLVFEIKNDVEGLDQILIPPLIIQPMIENAIIHGLEPKEGEGKLSITVSENEEMIIIEIEDNGLGISKETLNILNDKDSLPPKNSLGLKNVKNRMEFLYPNIHCFNIESELNVGTCVQLRFPKNDED